MARLIFKPPRPGRAVSAMAAVLIRRISERAFPQGTPGRDVNDQPFKPLTANYRKRKSEGMRVKLGGGSRRLGPRSTQPDQRLTDQTAKALGILEKTRSSITIGFRTARAKAVASYLQERNNYWPTTGKEEAEALDAARRIWRRSARSARIADGVIDVNVKVGSRRR